MSNITAEVNNSSRSMISGSTFSAKLTPQEATTTCTALSIQSRHQNPTQPYYICKAHADRFALVHRKSVILAGWSLFHMYCTFNYSKTNVLRGKPPTLKPRVLLPIKRSLLPPPPPRSAPIASHEATIAAASDAVNGGQTGATNIVVLVPHDKNPPGPARALCCIQP